MTVAISSDRYSQRNDHVNGQGNVHGKGGCY
jgi:hypothetical protein